MSIIERAINKLSGDDTPVEAEVAPAQPVADHKDDATENPPVINPRDSMRKREIRLNPLHLPVSKPNQITHAKSS